MSKSTLPFTPTGVDLDIADDRSYQDYMVKQAFRDGKLWMLFLEPQRVDRTLEIIRSLKSSIEQQLGYANRTQRGGDPEWRRRSINLLRQVETYLSDVRAEVKRLDAEEREESAEGERDAWKHVCALLVDLFHDNPALELITLPSQDMTAAEWARLRAAKIAARFDYQNRAKAA